MWLRCAGIIRGGFTINNHQLQGLAKLVDLLNESEDLLAKLPNEENLTWYLGINGK